MFLHYLNDMKSWILFFLMSLLSADLLLWLDPGFKVKMSSLLYLNLLLWIAFSSFIIWRFWKETAYTRKLLSLKEEPVTDWYEALPKTNFMRDEQINELLKVVGISFSNQLNDIRQTIVNQGDYTAAWVHEVKAPLTAMKILIDSNYNNPTIRRVEAEWLRIFLLIDQQLYISRLPTLESDYMPEKVGLNEIVSSEIRELRSWCREKNIAIEIEDLEEKVVTDRKWSRFVLRQILMNAVKYSPEGGTIYISTHVETTGHIVLSITDEGPGIPSHDIPRIFDKGFTGSTGRLHNAATGLGLYLAKKIADKIGISLLAVSNNTKGTTIEMVFSLENEFDKILK